MNKQTNWTAITIVIIVVLAIGSIFFMKSLKTDETNKEQTTEQETPKQNMNKTLDPTIFQYEAQPMLGSDKATVKVAEFADYKCPACKYFSEEIFPQLKKDYIDTGKIQFYSYNLAFLAPDSLTAAMVGEAVYKQNEEAYWTYNELVLKNQQNEAKNWATTDFLYDLIEKNMPEVNMEQLKKDVENEEAKENVIKDSNIAQTLEISGTPSVFVNGMEVEESMNYEAVKQAIEEELKKQ